MFDWQKLQTMSDQQIQDIWDAIWEFPPEERPDTEWQEDVYAQMNIRGLSVLREG